MTDRVGARMQYDAWQQQWDFGEPGKLAIASHVACQSKNRLTAAFWRTRCPNACGRGFGAAVNGLWGSAGELLKGAVQGDACEKVVPGGLETGADPSAAAGEGPAGGGMIEALMKPPVHDGSAGRGVHPDGSLVQDWEYFDNFFKRYNKVRCCLWGHCLWKVSGAVRVPEAECRTPARLLCSIPWPWMLLSFHVWGLACWL